MRKRLVALVGVAMVMLVLPAHASRPSGPAEILRAEDDLYDMLTGTELLVTTPGFRANDHYLDILTSPVAVTRVVVLDAVHHGRLTRVAPDGSFAYTPDASWIGGDSFTYCLGIAVRKDPTSAGSLFDGCVSNPATVMIVVKDAATGPSTPDPVPPTGTAPPIDGSLTPEPSTTVVGPTPSSSPDEGAGSGTMPDSSDTLDSTSPVQSSTTVSGSRDEGSAASQSAAPEPRESRQDTVDAFVESVPNPADTPTTVRALVETGLLVLLLLALLEVPVTIVNSTAEQNAELIGSLMSALTARLRLSGIGDWIARVPLAAGLMLVAVVSALLYGFLDPSLGLDRQSVAVVVGVAAAFLLINCVVRLSAITYLDKAFNVRAFVQLFPGFAAVAIACVVVTRVVGLEPGLLLGPLATLGLKQHVRDRVIGRAYAVAYASLALLTVAAWVSRPWVMAAGGSSGSFTADVLGVAMTTLVVAGIQGVVFNMIPLVFLDGSYVFSWSKKAWVALSVFGAFGFVHLLLNPASGTETFADRAGYLAGLLAIYLVAAFGFWASFRFRPRRRIAAAVAVSRADPSLARRHL